MNKVRCEIVEVGKTKCYRVGDAHTIGLRTEANMCAKLLHSLFPAAYHLMLCKEDPPKGHIDVTCPDGQIKARLTRLPAAGQD